MPGPTRFDNADDGRRPPPTRMDGPAVHQPPRTRMDGPAGHQPPRTRMDGTGSHQPPRTRMDGPGGHQPPSTTMDGAAPPPRPAAGGWTPLPSELHHGMQIVGELGTGGEGRVFLCSDTGGLIRQGQQFAVKVYHRDPEFAIEFGTHEFAAQFPYEHAVQVYRRRRDPDGRFYDVMEFCAAGTLADLLDQLPDSRTPGHDLMMLILGELTDALHAIQRPDSPQRMVHGDIKPENVLVRNPSRPFDLVLTDFGLSMQMHNRSRVSNTGRGTLSYSAPGAVHRTSLEADWWSLGMILFRAIVGRDYFTYPDGRHMPDHIILDTLASKAISLDRFDSIPWLEGPDPQTGQALRDRWTLITRGLLTRDPDQRWGHDEVQQWLRGESPQIHSETVSSSPESGGSGPTKLRATHPYAFAQSGELYTPADVAAAGARDLDGFARNLSGQGGAKLMHWVQSEFGERDFPFSKYQTSWSPPFRALYFISQLDPAQALSLNGFALNGRADLVRVAQSAATDQNALGLVRDLHGSGLIDALDSAAHRPGFVVIDAEWTDLTARAVDRIRETGQYQELQRAEERASGYDGAEQRMLARLVYSPALAATAGVADQVRTALQQRIDSSPEAREVGWFQRLLAG
ncbi:protein kinase domain-containing protein [Gordonia alkaliphila]|uniref:non-specific serine/threonine protein kinase n=1 Tax=Gordonia alkaliphila TaxID=1053547 RepID=A0ABP8ZJY3_9ACTN